LLVPSVLLKSALPLVEIALCVALQ
jgi:hypothetical protein